MTATATLPYNIYSKVGEVSSPCIIFVDYNGWWAPLASLYYSSSSKVLVSRHPESCIEEIISFYCPQCTLRYADEEVQLYRNQCPACFSCPCCEVPLYIVALSETSCCFQCGMCSWRSDVANITGKDKHELEAIVLAAERLDAAGDAFRDYISTLQGVDTQPAALRTPVTHARSPKWNLEQLERQQSAMATAHDSQHRINHLQPHFTTHDVTTSNASDTSSIASSLQLTSLHERLSSPRHQPALLASLSPRRVALRTKRTLRCRKDVLEGKLSILVQPKTFPLEGDSSQKLQQGKWWVKDASAVHMIPRFAITKLPDFATESSYLHLTITNYRDVDIIFSLILAADDDIDAELRSRHPPFVTRPTPLTVAEPPQYFTLRANEDDLLRDDTSKTIPLFAEEVPEQWSVVYDHNIAKISVPVTSSCSSQATAEMEFVLYVKEFNANAIPESGLDSRSLDEIKNKSMRVVFKIVMPVNCQSETS